MKGMRARTAMALSFVAASAFACGSQDGWKHPSNWPAELAFLSEMDTPEGFEYWYCSMEYKSSVSSIRDSYWQFEAGYSLTQLQEVLRTRLARAKGWTFPPFKEKWHVVPAAVRRDSKGKVDITIEFEDKKTKRVLRIFGLPKPPKGDPSLAP
jgi:hypothetical protein